MYNSYLYLCIYTVCNGYMSFFYIHFYSLFFYFVFIIITFFFYSCTHICIYIRVVIRDRRAFTRLHHTSHAAIGEATMMDNLWSNHSYIKSRASHRGSEVNVYLCMCRYFFFFLCISYNTIYMYIVVYMYLWRLRNARFSLIPLIFNYPLIYYWTGCYACFLFVSFNAREFIYVYKIHTRVYIYYTYKYCVFMLWKMRYNRQFYWIFSAIFELTEIVLIINKIFYL